MEAKKLMIGDWVYNPFTRKNLRLAFGRDIDLVEGLCLEPIPITAEILEKNGFKLHNRCVWIFKDNYCQIKVHIAPKLEIDGKILGEPPIDLQIDGATFYINMIIEYVYELQHCLRLCDIDKDIVL